MLKSAIELLSVLAFICLSLEFCLTCSGMAASVRYVAQQPAADVDVFCIVFGCCFHFLTGI